MSIILSVKPRNQVASDNDNPTKTETQKEKTILNIDEQTPEKLRAEIKETLKKFSSMTTSHGLPHLMEAKHFYIKIMWLLCMLSSFSLCGFMVFKGIISFASYEVTTTVRIENQQELEFPTISLCNLNPLVSGESYNYIKDYYETKYNTTFRGYVDLVKGIKNGDIQDDRDWLFYRTFDPNFDMTTRQSYGYFIHNMFAWCFFSYESCDLGEFEWYYHPWYGNCFKFNSGKNWTGSDQPLRNVSQEGNGFYIEIFTGLPDEYYWFFNAPTDSGITILIEDQKGFPIRQEGVLIKPGLYASMILSKTQSETLPDPYSTCIDGDSVDTELSREMKRLNYDYNRRNCYIFCEQKMNIEQLNCSDMRLPHIFDSKPCDTFEQFRKLTKLKYNFTQCEQQCPAECSLISYDKTISYANFPTYNYYLNLLNDKADYFDMIFGTSDVYYDVVHKSFSAVFIYYDELKLTKQTEDPSQTLIDLIANIGGTLGLFAGVSVLTFAEFVEVIVEALVALIKKPFKSKRRIGIMK